MKSCILIGLAFLASVSGKICWQNCSGDAKHLESIDIVGCRRRQMSTQHGNLKFRCDGMKGPPCTLKKGDIVNLKIDFVPDYPITELVQNAVWVTGMGIHIPWAGLDSEGCKYLNGSCALPSVTDEHTGAIMPQSFNYPIEILNFYPAGFYNLKWDFKATKPNGEKEEIACVNFAIKIV